MQRLFAWSLLIGLVGLSWFRAHLRVDAPLSELPLHALFAVGIGGMAHRMAGSAASVFAMAVGLLVLGDSKVLGVSTLMALFLWLQPFWPAREVPDPGRRLVGAVTLCLILLLVLAGTAPVALLLLLAPLLEFLVMSPEKLRGLPEDSSTDMSRTRVGRSIGCVGLLFLPIGLGFIWMHLRDLQDALSASGPLLPAISASFRELLMASPPLILGLSAALLLGPMPGRALRLGAWALAGLMLEAPLRGWSTVPTAPLLVFLIPATASAVRTIPMGFFFLTLVFGWEWFEKPVAVAPVVTAAEDQPDQQALYRYDGKTEEGPLLEKVSSVDVVRTEIDWIARFVRNQQIWESHSPDGIHWLEPIQLGIEGFDPTEVRDPYGNRWLLLVQTDEPHKDPARTPTKILRYRPKGDGWEFDAVLLSGMGLVDPAVRFREDRSWELYLTTPPTRIQRALSTDGSNFLWDPQFNLLDTSVAGVWNDWLVAQRHVKGRSMLFAFGASTFPLGLCGTGPSVADGVLYYSRKPASCDGEAGALPWPAP